MQWGDVAYYRERAAAERRLAAASENPHVAAIHEELARRYEELAKKVHLPPTLRIVVPTERVA